MHTRRSGRALDRARSAVAQRYTERFNSRLREELLSLETLETLA
jgi:hypothetical protein